jgi:arabinoxylan arabinofuranohydrolase
LLADYPIASHRYLADPASLVHDGRVYLYCSNDDDNVVAGGGDDGYKMASIVLVSSSDLKNWTDHGEVIRAPRDASWAYNTWAPAVIERNGTFYMYFGNSGGGIGVAKSSSPVGPFEDAKGSALITGSTPGASGQNMWLFDPGVFIDDDDQAYLYFGGNGDSNVRVIKLNPDMVSVSGSATAITAKGFFEASWMHKRDGVYYFSYSTNPANGMRIDYLTSSSPMTGFTYQGVVGDQPPSNSNNNHAAIFELNGAWYHAYHNRFVANEAGEPTTYRRNIALESLTYEDDGSIVPVTYTRDGLEQLHALDPYERVEGETFNTQNGVETEPCAAGGMNLSNIEDGDWVRLRGVDFGAGAESFTARVASATQGGSIELRLDSADGTLVGTCDVPATGDWQEWVDTSCSVDGAVGEHDLFLVFAGGASFLFNVDFWQFTPIGGAGSGGGNAGGSSGANGTGAASSDSGGASVSGGAAGVGSAVGVGGSGTDTAGGDASKDAAGCGCHSVSSAPRGAAWALAGLFVSLAFLRRRLRGAESNRRRLPMISMGAAAVALSFSPAKARADNPIIQHVYTADPAPMVHGDTVYLCTSHDEDQTVNGFFTMNDWFVFSSKDMVNWTDHGSPLSWQTFSWASSNKSWAPHCIERNGKFYMYVPVSDKIGVAVADTPLGPFEDAIGAPLLTNYQYIDPTVYIDEDGQAYLYFGNPKLWYVKLNDDMVSYTGGVQQIPMTAQSFGARRGGATADRPSSYEEGPWFYRRNDLYYLVYPTGALPEHIAYSTSPGPTGPWTYGGEIMNSVAGHAFTNHAGVIDFKGRSYFFYHTQELPGGSGYKRSVAVEEFTYEEDGAIPTIPKTSAGVTESVEPLNPYLRVEGETMAWGDGIEVEDASEGGRALANIEDGDFIKVESVDFLTGALSFEARVASAAAGGSIELHLDAEDGQTIGTCAVSPTGGWQTWTTVHCDVSEVSGVHDLFLVFSGGGGYLFNLDWYQFEPKDPLPGTGGSAAGGSAGGTGGLTGMGGTGSAMSTGGALSSSGGALGSSGGASAANANDEVPADDAGCACATGPGRAAGYAMWPLLGGLGIGTWLTRRRLQSHRNFAS